MIRTKGLHVESKFREGGKNSEWLGFLLWLRTHPPPALPLRWSWLRSWLIPSNPSYPAVSDIPQISSEQIACLWYPAGETLLPQPSPVFCFVSTQGHHHPFSNVSSLCAKPCQSPALTKHRQSRDSSCLPALENHTLTVFNSWKLTVSYDGKIHLVSVHCPDTLVPTAVQDSSVVSNPLLPECMAWLPTRFKTESSTLDVFWNSLPISRAVKWQ